MPAKSALTVFATPLAAQMGSDSSAFIKAVREGDGGKATQLLGAPGSTVANARDPGSGENALHIAIRRRDRPWTSFMVGRGVDPNAVDRSGDTPLGLAARLGFSEGARVLIAGGARVAGANARGVGANACCNSSAAAAWRAAKPARKPSDIIVVAAAAQGRRLDMVQMLMRQGADPDKADSAAGYSAKDYARQDRRSAAILRALEEKRAPAAAKPATPARAQ